MIWKKKRSFEEVDSSLLQSSLTWKYSRLLRLNLLKYIFTNLLQNG